LRGKFSTIYDDLSRVPCNEHITAVAADEGLRFSDDRFAQNGLYPILRRHLYRNGQLKISQLLLVLYIGGIPVNPSPRTIGAIYGLEGSAGARAAAVFPSHQVFDLAERLWQDRQPTSSIPNCSVCAYR